ncbi:hypothetical protein FRC01_007108, partial [Tulasnella sp. 417]
STPAASSSGFSRDRRSTSITPSPTLSESFDGDDSVFWLSSIKATASAFWLSTYQKNARIPAPVDGQRAS